MIISFLFGLVLSLIFYCVLEKYTETDADSPVAIAFLAINLFAWPIVTAIVTLFLVFLLIIDNEDISLKNLNKKD